MSGEKSDVEREAASEIADPSPEGAEGRYRPLRVWPAMLLVVGMVVARTIPKIVTDGPANLWMSAAFGPSLCGLLVLLWWLLFSRATWFERLAGVIGAGVGFAVTLALIDKSMIGPGLMVVTIPMGTAALAIGAMLCRNVLSLRRTVVAVLLAACGFGFSTLLRNDGLWGNFAMGLHWRWQPSPEERMLAARSGQSSTEPAQVAPEEFDLWLAAPQWPAFRGADRNGAQQGPVIATDWSTDPPEQIWKIAVGPAWSSFAVAGELLFTQEQRGAMETVVCYKADSGREVWTRPLESRFEDTLGGPGPRATPTLAGDGLFVMGASGQLMRLDPRTGDVVWQQDLREVADRKPPMWGFCSSPLVVDSVVVVHAGGANEKGTLAFDVETGDRRWSTEAGDHSYSSPHPATVAGEDLVLMLTNVGIDLVDPQTGEKRLGYKWKHEGYRSLQPHLVGGDSILLPTGMGSGTRRIRVAKGDDGWSAEEIWTSRHMKSDFNDLVVYQGHAYGFDGAVFTCIDLETGERAWKGGRYGKGQVLLLEKSGLLLIAGERGELVLVKADPAGHTELAKIEALKGKTWNHPVVVGDRLFIRNAQEAACYRLPLAESTAEADGTAGVAPELIRSGGCRRRTDAGGLPVLPAA